jgi:hypothetical protein
MVPGSITVVQQRTPKASGMQIGLQFDFSFA